MITTHATTPPELITALRIPDNIEHFGMYYQGSKATLDTGWSIRTFSFYGIYQRLIEHPLIRMPARAFNCCFGYDEQMPTHMLVWSRSHNARIFEIDQGRRFLADNRPHDHSSETEVLLQHAAIAKLAQQQQPIEALRELGMFESMLGAHQASDDAGKRINLHLNQQLTKLVRAAIVPRLQTAAVEAHELW